MITPLVRSLMTELDQKVIEDIARIKRAVADATGHPLYGTNKYWEILCEQLTQMIHRFGFSNFKRTVNFNYGQWRVRRLSDPKIRRLVWYFVRHMKIPWPVFSVSIDEDKVSVLPFPMAYRIFMGLLWERALLGDKLACLEVCDEPSLGAPLPVTYKGKLISQDLAQSSIETNLIASQVDFTRVKRVMEIGAGYGRFASVVVRMFGEIEYSIFDIPPALAISQNYLASTIGFNQVVPFRKKSIDLADLNLPVRIGNFLPHQLELFPDGYFDLAINISSFDEMTPGQVHHFFHLIDRKCKGWLYVKGYDRSRTGGLGLEEFPYARSWKCVYSGPDAVVPSFVEKIYRLSQDPGP